MRIIVVGLGMLYLALVSACSDSPYSSPEQSNNQGASSSSSSSSGSNNADLTAGAQAFAMQCAHCHDVTDQNIVKEFDLAGLTQVISSDMPLLNPSTCVADCATNVAAYIAQNNPFFGTNTAPPPSTGGFGQIVTPSGPIDPAPVVINRLNRAEYNNTVRDLLGTATKPADKFPEDDFGYGFNNIAQVLSVSLTHTEQYFQAAELLVEEALDKALYGGTQYFEANQQNGNFNAVVMGDVMGLLSSGSRLQMPFRVNESGVHQLTIRAGQHAAGDEHALMAVYLNAQHIQTMEVPALDTAMDSYAMDLDLTAGSHFLEVEFVNDYWIEGVADRNLLIRWLEIQGQGAELELIPCNPALGSNCARQAIQRFALRAWRRPPTGAEVDRLMALYETGVSIGSDFRSGLGQAMRAVLLSPHFLYRPELDSDLADHSPKALNGYELASRLSYFLWSSMPDDTLLSLAQSGALLEENTLRTQVRRMLDDPKAAALVENFAVQWLQFDRVAEADPVRDLFPTFSPELVQSMRQETRLFLHELFNTNAPIRDLLSADYSYLDNRLAQHYGLSGGFDESFERHTWADGERRGIIGHASILTMTSHPGTTSPVRRGVWVLESLLCKAPPAPPPGVENIGEDPSQGGLTTRERFELHRDTSSVCFTCHFLMDPIGFGLENYNAIGQWRNFEGDLPVDPSGALPGGLQFRGPLELAGVLAQSPELPLCVAEHVLTYALGRGVEASAGHSDAPGPDYPLVYSIYERTKDSGNRIRDMIEEVVASPAFRMRRGANSQGSQL